MNFPDSLRNEFTERFELIPLNPQRIEWMVRNCPEEEVRALLGSEEKYARNVAMVEGGMETFRFTAFYFEIRRRGIPITIGECGFHHIDKRHHKGELFYMLDNDSDKRQGIISEVLPFVLNYGFGQLGLHRIYAKLSPENTASLRLVQKNGFTLEGTLREDYLVDGVYESSDIYALVTNR